MRQGSPPARKANAHVTKSVAPGRVQPGASIWYPLDFAESLRDIALSTTGKRGIHMTRRRLTAVVGLVVVAAAVAVLLATGSTNTSSKTRQVASPRLNSM